MKPRYVKPVPAPIYDEVFEAGVAALNRDGQGTRVVHCKREPFDVYIGRPSKWGNPFTFKPGTIAEFVVHRDEVLPRYEIWLRQQPELMASLSELRGKTLGCWCAPKPCHGDILARLADEDRS